MHDKAATAFEKAYALDASVEILCLVAKSQWHCGNSGSAISMMNQASSLSSAAIAEADDDTAAVVIVDVEDKPLATLPQCTPKRDAAAVEITSESNIVVFVFGMMAILS